MNVYLGSTFIFSISVKAAYVYSQYSSIGITVCTTTKPPKKDAFRTSDHDRKAWRKIQELTQKSGVTLKELKSHSIPERTESDEVPCDTHND